MKIAIIFAYIKEANPFIFQSKFKFKKESSSLFSYIDANNSIDVFISGIGQKTFSFINKTDLSEYDLIIKAGTCAVIDPALSVLTTYIPNFIGNETDKISINTKRVDFLNKIDNLLLDKGLLTLDKPLFNEELHNDYLTKGFSFVDMESFYIIKKYPDKTFSLIAGTDTGSSSGKKDFFSNLNKASDILKNSLTNLIKLL